ncbi:MAG: FMN-binding negative transcriptional regulator [Polyangiaceae bacterium]|jgi:transcriptional regulator
MYIPAEFSEPDLAKARALIEGNSFGMLVIPRAGREPEIAHIPFLIDAEPAPFGTLRAHVARANPCAALLASEPSVVAVFTGPHAYVTPRWYESPRSSVPTWNFTAVHAHGVARPLGDREETRRALRDLSAKHEAGAQHPWSPDGADASYIERLLGGIVAFSIRIERLEAKAKLSQNRSAGDRARVAKGLRERGEPGDAAVAALIEGAHYTGKPGT